MLTEQQIARDWRNLFHCNPEEVCEETFERAEGLLEKLRAESPLRHRLGAELTELRKRFARKDAKPAKR